MIWRDLPGFEGYEVSNGGQIRSWWKTSGTSRARRDVPRQLTSRWRGGYLCVTISIGGKKHSVPIHSSVLQAFKGPRPNGMWALHRQPDRTDNSLQNLYWGTPRQNARDRERQGNGGKCAKLSAEEVADIRDRYASGSVRQVDLATEYGVKQAHISAIILRKVWT